MAARASCFIQKATVQQLKEKLLEMGQPSTGLKNQLQLRLEENVSTLSETEIERFFPVNRLDDEGGENCTREQITGHHEDNEVQERSLEPTMGDLDQELNHLREMLKKKREIAELRRRLSDLCSEDDNVTSQHTYSFRDVEESLQTFSGDDNLSIQKWIQGFEDSREVLGWDERKSFIYAQRLLRGTAKLFLRSISCKSWRELKLALEEEFHHHVTAADIHETLRMRKKRREETLQQYVLAMQEIATLSDIAEQDLMHYIIRGIPDSSVNKQILYNANNIAELKQALRKYEKMKAYITSEISSQQPPRPRSRNPQREKYQVPSKTKCFNCNDFGHVSGNCPKPPRQKSSCFRCGQQGHIATNCRQSSSVMVVENIGVTNSASSGDPGIDRYELLNSANDFHFLLSYTFFGTRNGEKTSMKAMTVLDTGSPISFVKESYVPPCFISPLDPLTSNGYHGINNSELNILGRAYCSVDFKGNVVSLYLFVVSDSSMRHPIVLGRDFLKISNVKLVVNSNDSKFKNSIDITVDKSNTNDVLHSNIYGNNFSNNEHAVTTNIDDNEVNFLRDILNIDVCLNDVPKQNLCLNENLKPEEKELLKSILESGINSNDNDFKENSNFEMKITLTNDSVFNCVPRRLAFAHKVELKKILDDLLQRKVIRESSSPFASPIVLTRKKNGELRLCVDYRELNKVTQKDNYPLPLIEDHLDRLRGKGYFSLLDLKNGFHHVRVSGDSIKYTSFVTPLGQYEYLRMPFGLKNAPAVFQRYINSIFKHLIDKGKVLIYIDDLLVASETVGEHFEILKEVMKVVNENNLKLRLDKCKFMFREITYLGYEVSARGIGPNMEGLRAVREFPLPRNAKDVHSFLGMCSYFRKFIKDFAIISKPLYDLVKKDANFNFGPNELKTFELLKEKLQQSPLLSIYNPLAETELHCDASSLGFGAVLLQRQADKKLHPVFFFSKRTTPQETKYHSYELETLAIIYALRRFRIYLMGIKFKIVTDCKSLTLTLNKKLLNPRISRWALELQDFDYIIEHRNNSRMSHVDALSRCHNILLIDAESFEHALAVGQHRDPVIKNLVTMLEQRESPSYELINGLVYRKLNDKVFFYVPSQMERNVIQTHHDALCHVGVEKLYDYLRQTYWFPFMKAKIKNHIANCLRCIHFSPPAGKKEGELHNIPKGKAPFEVVHIDHYGPLPTSVLNTKKYILVIVDGFTKFTKLYPSKTTTTKEVLQCLQIYFKAYSKPHRIVSDRGSCFTSEDFTKFCQENDIQHIKVATCSPQSNGQVERVNRCLTPMLSKESEAEPGEWSRYLDKVEFAINNTANRSTGSTPSMLLFGTNQKGDVNDNVRQYLLDNVLPVSPRDLDQLREKASQRIVRSQDVNKAYFDKTHKPPQKYKVGDYVLIKNVFSVPGINKKLLPKYKGPYEVIKVLPNDRYVIRDAENIQLSRVPYTGIAAPENLRPYLNES